MAVTSIDTELQSYSESHADGSHRNEIRVTDATLPVMPGDEGIALAQSKVADANRPTEVPSAGQPCEVQVGSKKSQISEA
jgi:hypothetical protein